ncbi:hypothetical protein BGM25_05370, partial [Bacillus sp. FJAT-29953]|nr:hypothetical protein [Bacillus sp. FJAT-29953]
QIVEKVYFSRQFFILSESEIHFYEKLSLLMGLLISAPGASLSAGGSGGLLGAFRACGVSPVPYSRRSLRTFRSNQQGDYQTKELQHTFSSLNKCVAIFFMF